MCGIAGIVATGSQDDGERAVHRMLGELTHRGPDDEGVFAWTPADGAPGAVLGNRRLAILDRTPAGHQPMLSPDGRYALTLNGEIYNYLELRTELERSGWRFRSGTDTEVLLSAFAAWGPRCLDRISGMFAFAVLDTKRREVFLARDPFGIKPLFYAIEQQMLLFASEAIALMTALKRRPSVNTQALMDYLQHGVIDIGDQTAFRGVRALPPGHSLSVPCDGEPGDPVAYWQPGPRDPLDIGFDEAVIQYRDRFLTSIERHLRADVPVGALLSGGLDSSAAVMAMREVGGSRLELHTFSFVSGPGGVNEERWIDDVNRTIRAIPHKLTLESNDWWRERDEFAKRRDEPIGSPVVFIQQRLFREARQAGVLAVLTGQGSDELNAGYAWYRPARIAADLRRGRLSTSIRFAVRLMRRGGIRSVRTLARGAAMALLTDPSWRIRSSPPWIDRTWAGQADRRRRRHLTSGPNVLHDQIAFRLRVGLPDLLRFEDRSAMVESVEPRVPFLTRELADFVLALPAEYLVGPHGETKHLLREACRGLVPSSILARPTRVGFSFPAQQWLTVESGRTAWNGLRDRACIDAGYMRDIRERLVSPDSLGPGEVYAPWRLLGLDAWARRFDFNV